MNHDRKYLVPVLFLALSVGATIACAVMYCNGCAAPLPSKAEVVKVGTDSQTCKQRLHEAVTRSVQCPPGEEDRPEKHCGCPALLIELRQVASDDPSCIEAKQYANFRCVPHDAGKE